jgi:hypothetical protein
LLFALAMGPATGIASAQATTSPNIIVSQETVLAAFPGGGGQSGAVPAGDTLAVSPLGVIGGDTYGNQIVLYPSAGGTPQVLGSSVWNPAGVAVDAQNNLYIALSYGATILKVPYVNGAYAAIGAGQTINGNNGPSYPVGTPNCTGNDTVECLMSDATTPGQGGINSLVFDAQGDLFYATSSNTGSNPNAIFECTAACLYTGTPAPTLLFQEATSSTGTTTGQLNIGDIAVDTAGNIFFTDSAINTSVTQESFSSNLNELPVSSSQTTGYASSQTVIYSYTPPSVGQYNNEIDGVAVDANDTVYALIQNTGGIIAFPSTGGAYSTSDWYTVSNVNGKMLAMDKQGNFYEDTYVSGDTMVRISVNNLTAAPSATGSPSTTGSTVTTFLNDSSCSSTPTVTFASSSTAFAAATSGTCSSTYTGDASYATTVTFTPTFGGINTAKLTATDSVSSTDTDTATVTGVGTGTLATPTFSPAAGSYTAAQTVTISDASGGASIYYTTDGSTPMVGASDTVQYTVPIAVSASETINAIAVDTGDTNSADATAQYTLNIPPAATPVFSNTGGTFTTPQSVTLSDSTSGSSIYYTTDGTTPMVGASDTVLYTGPITVSTSETITAIATALGAAASSPATAAFTISLPASAFQNVVITQSTEIGTGIFSSSSGGYQSGSVPAGDSIAVNSLGDVITGDTYGNEVFLLNPQTGVTSVLGTLTNVNGVAVDSQNNLYIGFSYTPAVLKIPFVNGAYAAIATVSTDPPYPSGTPNCNGSSDTVECVMNNVTAGGADIISMVFDSAGDLFYSSGLSGGTNNAIFECTVACLYSTNATPAPTQLFQEQTNSTAQLSIGGLALDTSNDLFFTDSAIAASQESASSNLNELPVASGGTGYATTQTVIYTYTPSAAVAYGAEIDGVAVAANGTAYALFQGAASGQDADPGILAFPVSSGTYNSSQAYLVSTQNGKAMTNDALGNLYVADDAQDLWEISVDNLTLPSVALEATPSTATNITTILNDGTCSSNPTVTFAASGTSASAFSATTTGTCASTTTATGTGASFATTVTFTPSAVGTNSATLTATDSSSNTGAAAVSGTGIQPTAVDTPTFSPVAGTYNGSQTVTISDATTSPVPTIYYTTDGSAPVVGASDTVQYSGPITVSSTETITAIAVATGLTNSASASAIFTITPPAATPTFSPAAGTFETVQTVTISDATAGATIYYTTDGTTPMVGSGSAIPYTGPIIVGATETINAIATATGYSSSAEASAAYTINLPAPSFTITSANSTVTVPSGGSGTVTLTLTANAAFNGGISFACAGFLPIGDTCSFNPASVTLTAGGSSTTTLTVSVATATASIHHGPSPLLPGTMMAAALCLLGFRKRRGLQMMLLLVISAIGLTMFSGCTSTTSSSATSSQIAVTATGASCPATDLTCVSNPVQGGPTPTTVVQTINLVLTAQ